MAEIKRFGSETLDEKKRPHTVALGIGGAGRNILTSMKGDASLTNMKKYEVGVTERLPDYPFIEVNMADMKGTYTSGLGVGKRPMNETEKKIGRRVQGADILYLVSGLGGETGSLTSYACSQIGDSNKSFTIALMALPFKTENTDRREFAAEAQEKIARYADIVAVFANSKLMKINPYLPMTKAFDVMNSIIRMPVEDFNTVITAEDIPHLKRFCSGVDEFRIGAGYGKGRERGKRACDEAFRSPWLDDIEEYRTVLAVVTSGKGLAEMEAEDALSGIQDKVPDVDIMWGLRKDLGIGNRTKVTVLAGK